MPCVHERDVSIEIVQYTRSGVQPAGNTVLHSVTLHAVGSSVRLSVGRESFIYNARLGSLAVPCTADFLFYFLSRDAMQARPMLSCVVCPSVRLSVRHIREFGQG